MFLLEIGRFGIDDEHTEFVCCCFCFSKIKEQPGPGYYTHDLDEEENMQEWICHICGDNTEMEEIKLMQKEGAA